MADPLKQIFSRQWPRRVLGLQPIQNVNAAGEPVSTLQQPLLGDTNPAHIQTPVTGDATGSLKLIAGNDVPNGSGRNLTLTVTNTGTLGVTSNGFDITVTINAGTTTATLAAAAVNSQFLPDFVTAVAINGSGYVAEMQATNFIANERSV